MFKHNLQDLVKGIRAHKGETQAKYVAKEIVAIKDELKMPEARVKVRVCARRGPALSPSPPHTHTRRPRPLPFITGPSGVKANLPRDDWPRYRVGRVPRRRGHGAANV